MVTPYTVSNYHVHAIKISAISTLDSRNRFICTLKSNVSNLTLQFCIQLVPRYHLQRPEQSDTFLGSRDTRIEEKLQFSGDFLAVYNFGTAVRHGLQQNSVIVAACSCKFNTLYYGVQLYGQCNLYTQQYSMYLYIYIYTLQYS